MQFYNLIFFQIFAQFYKINLSFIQQ